jgi:hypothetical protein
MLHVSSNEFLPFILGLIQSNYMGDAEVFEYLQVVLGQVASFLLSIVYGPHERKELIWNNPIYIAVFNLFIVLIFF